MKRTNRFLISLFLVLVMLFGAAAAVSAQAEPEKYIPVHTEEELKTLFTRVKEYLDENGETVTQMLDETENRVVTSALIRAWGITQYENATPQQIDDAYDALYNMFLFLGLAIDPEQAFSSGQLFQYAVQLLDQEYYDLLKAAGELPENIEYAAYLRDIAEALVEDPESFTSEEVADWLLEIYQETYYAAGLKAIAHTEALPIPEELFGDKNESAMMPNPVVKYDTPDALNQFLGIKMPELPAKFGAKLGYYSIISDILAESEYEFDDGALVIFRLAPEPDLDISGVYGASFYKDWEIASTLVEVDTYSDMFIALGNVQTLDERVYSFAVDAEGMDEERFYQVVTSFVESCRNQRTAAGNGD